MCADEVIEPFLEEGGQLFGYISQGNLHHVNTLYKAFPTPCAVAVLYRLRIVHIGVDLDVIFIADLDRKSVV